MQEKLAFLLLVAGATFGLPSQKGSFKILRSPSSGLEAKQGEYIIKLGPLENYEWAKISCEGIGAKLAELETKEEEDYVINWVIGLGLEVDTMWVAGKWNGSGSFVWESGVPFCNDSSWLPGEPSERNEGSRVALLAKEKASGFKSLNEEERNQCLCEYL